MGKQMSFTGTVPRIGKRDVSILELLAWAFQREMVSLDFDEIASETGSAPGFGMEWIMIERARLGCRVDGGGKSEPHDDAQLVAAMLMVLPENVGGRQMALQIAELARFGACPNWGQGAVPKCEPVAWRNSKHGRFGVREFNRDLGTRWPAHQTAGKDWGYVCPVVFSDTASLIAKARRNYLLWFGALLELRNMLQSCGNLSAFNLIDDIPSLQPWKKSLT